jgi:hypothetical protein
MLYYDALNEYHNIIQSNLSAAAAGLFKTAQHKVRRLERGRKIKKKQLLLIS